MHPFAPAEYQYIGLFALALIILRIPHVGKYFRVVNTLFHENAHAVMALLTSGSVVRVDLFSDTSGACVFKSKYWISTFFINLAGYVGSSASAFGMFWLLTHGHSDWLLYTLAGTAALNLLLWVRNKYGIFWLITFLLICAGCYYLKNEMVTYYFLFLICALHLVESLWSTLVLLYLSAEEPSSAGDARNLRQMTFIPAIVWALLFVAQAVFFTVWCADLLFGTNWMGIFGF